MLVYLATNLKNKKKYVGYTTKTLEERKKEHLYKSRSKNEKSYFYIFKQAIRNYGIELFSWEILCHCSNLNECIEKEKYFIKELNTISPNGYNLTEGGNGGKQSKETKEKISSSLKEYFKKNGTKDNISKEDRIILSKKAWETKKNKGYKPKTGYIISEESRKNMSVSKNEKNKIKWINLKTGETKELSCTKMSELTGLSISIFNHIKNGRQIKTKCGWSLQN